MAKTILVPVDYTITTTPTSPPTGRVRVYAKSDKHLYQLDSTGVETDLAAASGGGRTFAYFAG